MGAETLAENIYFSLLQKSKRGRSLKSKSFHLEARAFINNLPGKVVSPAVAALNETRRDTNQRS